jgi:glycosyltransferase involved in cell wall biosynthesis
LSVPPTVSVIVPFLDEERFLDEAVESVLAQTIDTWELLLVDDGSVDGSPAVARNLARADAARITYLQHEGDLNRGMSASRNLGLAHARGRYLAFLDADDVWVERKLEEQVELLEAAPDASLVYGAAEWWYSWTGLSEDAGRDEVWWPFPDEGVVEGTRALVSLLRAAAPTTTTSLVRSEAAARVGGFEEGFRDMHEDQAFFAKLCLLGPVIASSSCWYRWRQHRDSCCAVSLDDGAWPWQRRRFFDWLAFVLRGARVEDRELWTALEEERGKIDTQLAAMGSTPTTTSDRSARRRSGPARSRRPTLRARRRSPGAVALGDLRRTEPISREWGFDRGTPIDRRYIEEFLERHAADVRGRVLEVGDDEYTRRFGGNRVALRDVLHVRKHPRATIVADLASAGHLPDGTWDCIILTQTLQLIYELPAAIEAVHRILTPSGVVLATVPGITHTGDAEFGSSWCWSLTTRSAKRLFEHAFGEGAVEVEGHGNVLAAVAFLEGLAAEELSAEELAVHDPAYDVTIAVRAVKGDSAKR